MQSATRVFVPVGAGPRSHSPRRSLSSLSRSLHLNREVRDQVGAPLRRHHRQLLFVEDGADGVLRPNAQLLHQVRVVEHLEVLERILKRDDVFAEVGLIVLVLEFGGWVGKRIPFPFPADYADLHWDAQSGHRVEEIIRLRVDDTLSAVRPPIVEVELRVLDDLAFFVAFGIDFVVDFLLGEKVGLSSHS